jgi:ATP-dependent Clp protease protease subunit
MWKYDLTLLQQKLLDHNIIDLGGEVDQDMATYVRVAIAYLVSADAPEICVKISSNGGDIPPGLNIYDELRLYPGRITGVVSLTADSMAAIILQACDHRQCMKHSTVTIHNMWRKLPIDKIRNQSVLEKELADMEKWQLRINMIYVERTKRTLRAIMRQSDKDKPMTAEEALKFHLIDEII